MQKSQWSQGYEDGRERGLQDRLIGLRSEYASHAFESESAYRRGYAAGYRDGNAERYAVPCSVCRHTHGTEVTHASE